MQIAISSFDKESKTQKMIHWDKHKDMALEGLSGDHVARLILVSGGHL